MSMTLASVVGLGMIRFHSLWTPQLTLQEMCVAENVYHEASLAGQSVRGQRMVAFVTVARAAENREKWGGDTYCGVVLKYKQFSWTLDWHNFLHRPRGALWEETVQATLDVTRGGWKPEEGLDRARYYMNEKYAARKNACNFQKEFTYVGTVGDHDFYAEPSPEELINLQRKEPVPAECKPLPKPKHVLHRHHKGKRKHHRGRY